VNVISNGSRLATIAGTFDGSIPNFGGYNTVWVDISQFAGLDDVEFWFIANSDASVVDGFGALFDNVEVIVDDLPFFTSSGGGTIAPGESEIIDITIRTELLPPGDFVLYTDVFSNGFISYYGGGALFHTSQFSARNVALEIDPMEDWIGEASTEEATVFSFDADNIGTVGVDYFADVMIAYDFMDDFFGDGLVQGRDAALGRFAESNKGPGSPIDLVQHRNVILDNLSSRTGISNGSNRTADVPRMSPSREDLDIYFEDFETGLNEGWEIFDFSFGLGHAFNVENWGSVDFPDNFLNVGGISENGWFIFNDTYTLAFSESFDLSAVPNSDEVVMEFTYSFLLEPGFDFGSVWIGVETEDGTELYLVGSSEDIFWNDGFVYRTGIDISEFAGMDGVFMAFLVETDGSVQSGWTGFNDLDVYTTERLAYIDPYEGSIDVGESQTFNVTVNTPWLYPGDYIAISVIDYYSEDLFVGRSAEQFTYFEIPNMKPVAEDDFLAVITDEIIPIDYILGMMLFNDYDVDGQVYLYDVSDPLFGDIKYTFDGLMYVAPEEGGKVDMMQYIITDGQLMDTATVYMSVGDNPHFPVGADQQFVFLEDEGLTMNTTGMAAGVGFWDNVFVWASSHDSEVTITHDAVNHSLTFDADDNAFGQFSATLYVGTDDGTAWDSTEVSIIVTPVNDAPVAEFTTNIDGSTVEFVDLSSDELDMSAGGIISWAWDFGDGNTSTDASPTYDYGTTGDFTVTLTVTDNGGLTNTFTAPVEIMSVSNEVLGGVPTVFAIEQNYPNPFNPSTNINYSLPEASKVSIVVYDLLGQKVAELVNTEKAAGYHTVAFDASALSSGIYIYQIRAGAFSQTKKMMLIK
jgi:PKD repeat protein